MVSDLAVRVSSWAPRHVVSVSPMGNLPTTTLRQFQDRCSTNPKIQLTPTNTEMIEQKSLVRPCQKMPLLLWKRTLSSRLSISSMVTTLWNPSLQKLRGNVWHRECSQGLWTQRVLPPARLLLSCSFQVGWSHSSHMSEDSLTFSSPRPTIWQKQYKARKELV